MLTPFIWLFVVSYIINCVDDILYIDHTKKRINILRETALVYSDPKMTLNIVIIFVLKWTQTDFGK